ncbi:hypothetical protein [Marichromatium gracile]|uniref:Uncharacterized protein n=1 Tax=Marichromatium gracile TaxID=1048 RepID=A0A4R4AGP4_MARGR|nr:hypothetical protein [Marichromatium gracile]MBK1707925.1 hypothetical protein [Marichromatium gracile]TCW38442.1 hypothetical protein EDC29_102337 [Marichromatium gracile]
MADQIEGDSAQHGIEALIQALRDDTAQRARLGEQLERLLAASGPERQLTDIHGLEQRLHIEERRHTRAKWYTAVLGLFALLIGAVLFYLVFMMARDMNRMEDYMYNMGHATDDARTRPFEFKAQGESYMATMAGDMGAMRTSIEAMREDMGQMRLSIDGMSTDITAMSRDMTQMNATIGRIQYDTLLMRQGVGGMASDTRAMGAPFRVMDSMAPW